MDAIRNCSGVGAHNVILAPGAVNVSCRVQPSEMAARQPVDHIQPGAPGQYADPARPIHRALDPQRPEPVTERHPLTDPNRMPSVVLNLDEPRPLAPRRPVEHDVGHSECVHYGCPK